MQMVWRRILMAASLALSVLGASLAAAPRHAVAEEAGLEETAAPEAGADAGAPDTLTEDDILASDWVAGHKSRTRLSAGRQIDVNKGPQQLYAFIEIDLSEGWKTYWRSPGDSGIPPHFEFSKSKNLESANPLYTAPTRITDKGETIIGYKGRVLFPVALTPADPSEPVELVAEVQFGMCKDICVPTEAQLQLTIPPGVKATLSRLAKRSLTRVPRSGDAIMLSDPHLTNATAETNSGLGKISVKAVFPGGGAAADAFLEAPDGLYLPPLTKKSESGEEVVFEADITKDVDISALRGKIIGVTLASPAGASEASFTFE